MQKAAHEDELRSVVCSKTAKLQFASSSAALGSVLQVFSAKLVKLFHLFSWLLVFFTSKSRGSFGHSSKGPKGAS